MNILKTSILLLACTLITTTTFADVDVNYTLTDENNYNYWFPADGSDPAFGGSYAYTNLPFSPSLTPFTIDFSTINTDTTLNITLNSSTGRFYANFPEAGGFFIGITADRDTHIGTDDFDTDIVSVTFNGLIGAPDITHSFSNASLGTSATPWFTTESSLTVNSPTEFSFESVTVSFTVPASYNTDFSTFTEFEEDWFAFSITASVDGAYPAPFDYGQFFSLNPIVIPEPASISLLALSSLALIRRRK
ncbi:PEP-CTERM sorting domain-containing protein [Planctomycetota bacterium]|nr:PEP-CTERM sorting domain-containing protein [Planctomycetota bacterium]